jgi:hypothetical protein
MKQKKLSKKERKQMRDQELAQRGIDPIQRREKAASGGSMNALISRIDDEASAESFIMAVAESGILADEPELVAIYANPGDAIRAMFKAVQQVGMTAEGELSTDEEDQIKMQELVARKLLTKEFRKQIKEGVDNLVRRLEQEKNPLIIQASAAQIVMNSAKKVETWMLIGLVSEIVRRSVEAGMRLTQASLPDDFDPDHDQIESLMTPENMASLQNILDDMPGLNTYIEQQVDHVWSEGLEKIIHGKLQLDLYSPDEVEFATARLQVVFGQINQDDEGDQALDHHSDLFADLVNGLRDYLTKKFDAARIDQIVQSLAARANDRRFSESDRAFISLAHNRMQMEEAVNYESEFLIKTLLSEGGFVVVADKD